MLNSKRFDTGRVTPDRMKEQISKYGPILVVTFFIVLSAILRYRVMADFTYFVGDAARYLIEARNVLAGRGILDDFVPGYLAPNLHEDHIPIYAFTEPLNPVLLALVCWLTGTDIFHGWIFQPLIFSSLNVFLMYLVARRLFSAANTDEFDKDPKGSSIFHFVSAPVLCAGLLAFHPKLFNIGTVPHSETVFTTILLLGFYGLMCLNETEENDNKEIVWFCVLGLICGIAFLQRFHGITLLPGIILSVVIIKGLNRRSIVGIPVIVLFFLITLIPHFVLMGLHEGDIALPLKVTKSILFEPRPWQSSTRGEGLFRRIFSSLFSLWKSFKFTYSGSLFATLGNIVWLSIIGFFLSCFFGEKAVPKRKLFYSAGLILLFALWAIAMQPMFYYIFLNYRGTYPYVVFFIFFAVVPLSYMKGKTFVRALYTGILLLFIVLYIKLDYGSEGFLQAKHPPPIYEPIVSYLKNNLKYDDTTILSTRADYFALYSGRKGVVMFPNVNYEGLKTMARNYKATHFILTSRVDRHSGLWIWDYSYLLDTPERELPNWLTLEREFHVMVSSPSGSIKAGPNVLQKGRLFRINQSALQ